MRFAIKGIPGLSETIVMSRDILIAEATDPKLHINHSGSKWAVDLVKTIKQKGVQVTWDVTPFLFFLTDTEIADYDPNFKFTPPIGNKDDVQAIKEGLRDEGIDVITSDHIPWTAEEKNVEFDQAPFGAIGLETVLGMSYTALVLNGGLKIEELLEKLTINPAKVLGLPLGCLMICL